MKAFSKKIALMVVALMISLCMGLTACGTKVEPPPQTVTYTVTVQCEEALLLPGVKVLLKAKDGTVAGESELDENNKATFALPAATYSVDIAEMSGFEGSLLNYVWTNTSVTPTSPGTTVTLSLMDDSVTEGKVNYTVTAQLPDGTPVEGIMVQLCKETCNPKMTDVNGVAVFLLYPDVYEVHIAEAFWPDGYTFDDTAYTTTTEGGSLTVVFTAA